MKKDSVDTDQLHESYVLLMRTASIVRRLRRFELYRLGFRVGFTGISFLISKHGNGMTVSELAALTYLQPHTVTEMINRMEKAGLVRKEQDPRDKRVVRIALTRQGVQNNEMSSAHREVIQEVLGCLTSEEISQFSGHLKRLRDRAQELEKETNLKLGRR